MDKKLRIAVIKTDGIGDAVLASPFLFELRKNFKDAHITGILSRPGADALRGLLVFDEIITYDAKWLEYKKTSFLTRLFSALGLAALVNKGRYDMAIGLRWQDRLSSLVLSLCNAKDKYGYNTGGMGFGINHKITPLPAGTRIIDREMNVLSRIIPGKKFKIKTSFSIGPKAEAKTASLVKKSGKYIVIQPVSNSLARNWPIEKFRDLSLRLAKTCPVFIIGTASDAGINTITGRNITNTAGKLSISEMGALIKRSHMVIGNNSAAVHIASVFNVKSLTVFSSSVLYEEWGASGSNSYILTKDVFCRKCELAVCDKKVHECMDFDVDDVEKLARKILAGKQKSKIIKG